MEKNWKKKDHFLKPGLENILPGLDNYGSDEILQTDDLSDSSTPDSDQGIRNQCSFPERWINKTDQNSKEEAGRQMEVCESHRKERLTPDMVHLHTTSGESAVFSYRNFRDLTGEPYPVEFASEGWPKVSLFQRKKGFQ